MTLATSIRTYSDIRTPRALGRLLGATALSLPLLIAPLAHAQQQQGQTQQSQSQGQQQTQGQACRDLQAMLESEDPARLDFSDLRRIVNQGEDNRCVVILARVTEAGGMAGIETDDDVAAIVAEAEGMERRDVDASAAVSESATITETVEIERRALVEGEVVVSMPNPEIAVTQGAPEIDIRQTPPDVRVRQNAAEILVRQAPQRVRIEMAAPTITIEQAAPEIIITMPDPSVDVASAEPQVEVRMSDPQVTVTQADPQIAMNLQARIVAPEEADRVMAERGADGQGGVRTRTERGEAVDGRQADVTMETAAAVVTQSGDDVEANVEIVQAEPTVRFESAEPQLEFTMTGEPDVQLRQTGEPKVTIRQAEGGGQGDGDDSRAAAMRQPAEGASTENRADAAEGDVTEPVEEAAESVGDATETAVAETRDAVTPERAPADAGAAPTAPDFAGTQSAPVMVGEIVGLEVYNMNDVELGEVDRVVTDGGRHFIIVQRGGFLGLGRNVYALPLDRVVLSGGRIVLEGLTEAELEAMPEYDAANETALSGAEQVEMLSRS